MILIRLQESRLSKQNRRIVSHFSCCTATKSYFFRGSSFKVRGVDWSHLFEYVGHVFACEPAHKVQMIPIDEEAGTFDGEPVSGRLRRRRRFIRPPPRYVSGTCHQLCLSSTSCLDGRLFLWGEKSVAVQARRRLP